MCCPYGILIVEVKSLKVMIIYQGFMPRPGPKNRQDCLSHLKNAPSLNVPCPAPRILLSAPPRLTLKFFSSAPPRQKKSCPCIPDADDLGDDDHDDHDDHDDGDFKHFWRWSPKSYRNIYLGLEQFPRWEGKGGD